MQVKIALLLVQNFWNQRPKQSMMQLQQKHTMSLVVVGIGLASMINKQKVHGSTTVMDKKFHGQTGVQMIQVVEVARIV